MTKTEELDKMLKHHKRIDNMYSNLDSYELLMMKRTINSAFMISSMVEKISFERLGLAMYMNTKDSSLKQFIRLYEFQMEEANLNKENFVTNLHSFLVKTGKLIINNNTRNFFDFFDFVVRKSRTKSSVDSIIFDAYISLLLQQCAYLGYLKGYKEKMCCGITTDDEVLFLDDLHPYSDCPSYDLEDLFAKALKKGRLPDISIVKKEYKKYGYDINGYDDIEFIEGATRVYNNNISCLMTYVNEYTQYLLPTKPFEQKELDFPRKWNKTEVYQELLSQRKFCLPSNGLEALFFNSGDIKKINFQEIYKNDKIILLYRVETFQDSEFSGYYDTQTHDFYSIFERSNFVDCHVILENFILENYCTLTCSLNTDRKRLSVLKQVEDIKKIDSFCANQPVVSYLYREKPKDVVKGAIRKHYNRESYKSEKTSVNGYIRKLPIGQSASSEAILFATKLGYLLNIDETYVRPFQKTVLRIKEV